MGRSRGRFGGSFGWIGRRIAALAIVLAGGAVFGGCLTRDNPDVAGWACAGGVCRPPREASVEEPGALLRDAGTAARPDTAAASPAGGAAADDAAAGDAGASDASVDDAGPRDAAPGDAPSSRDSLGGQS